MLMRSGFVAILIFISSCTSTKPTPHEPVAVTAPATAGFAVSPVPKMPPADVEENDTAGECPPPVVFCAQDDSPTVCMALSYNGRKLSDELTLKGWGSNACLAKVHLITQACAQHKRPSRLGDISCAPDPAHGECPPAAVACSDDYQPTVCEATQYGGQSLSWLQTLKAWGKNPCQAQSALKAEACQQNLAPSKIDGISCAPSDLLAKCPADWPPCAPQYAPVRCRFDTYQGKPLGQPLVVLARNECEARARLARGVCLEGKKLEDFPPAVCEPRAKFQ